MTAEPQPVHEASGGPRCTARLADIQTRTARPRGDPRLQPRALARDPPRRGSGHLHSSEGSAKRTYPPTAQQRQEGMRVGRAVTKVLRLLPTDSRCLIQAIVLTAMLARRGVDSTVVIGVRSEPSFGAHAWVELDGSPLLPTDQSIYRRLAEM